MNNRGCGPDFKQSKRPSLQRENRTSLPAQVRIWSAPTRGGGSPHNPPRGDLHVIAHDYRHLPGCIPLAESVFAPKLPAAKAGIGQELAAVAIRLCHRAQGHGLHIMGGALGVQDRQGNAGGGHLAAPFGSRSIAVKAWGGTGRKEKRHGVAFAVPRQCG